MASEPLHRWFGILFLAVVADSLLLFSARDSHWTTAVLILIHLFVGFGLFVVLIMLGWKARREGLSIRATPRLVRTTLLFLVLSFALGIVLILTGAFGWGQAVLGAHIAAGAIATLLVLACAHQYSYGLRLKSKAGVGTILCALVLVALAGAGVLPQLPEWVWGHDTASAGFFPSRSSIAEGRLIDTREIANSRYCGECHEEIYEQWRSSQHHLASFGNIFYQRAALYTIERKGAVAFRFCAGCHDPALIFSGQADAPQKIDVGSPAALEGLACVGCHAMQSAGHSGTGSYVIERPRQFPFANHADPRLRTINKLLIRLKPDAHRRSFLKPFHRQAEFCGSCHKVTIEAAVNEFRWVRGFSEYDDWQRSGFSGHAGTTFYTATEAKRCQDCHMPVVASRDLAEASRGFVHDHRFLGSNTAVPLLRKDPDQFERVRQFLTQAQVTVDIFAVAEGEYFGRSDERSRREWMALDRAQPSVRLGAVLTVDVVVRNRNVGHRFPAGTLDLWDAWLEFSVTDARGKTIFSSGHLIDGGEVDPQAHFFRNRPLDRHGKPTDKSNRFDTVTTLYDSSVPPGQAEVIHYQFRVPENAQGPLTLGARLNHRKYTPYFARWVFGGKPAPGQERRVSSKVDDRDWIIEDVPLPRLPILSLAGDTQLLGLLGSGRPLHPAAPAAEADALRFNDYGIGLFRQGDYKRAEQAFQRVIQLDPHYADGFINVARVLLAVSRTDEAEQMVETALRLRPHYPKAIFHRSSSRLFRNLGQGKFQDVTKQAGLYNSDGKALGVALWDFDGNGLMDLVVAEDTQPDKLYLNRGHLRFEEVGLRAGLAVSESGLARAGMGIDVADVDNNGREAVAIGNFSYQSIGFYRPVSPLLFADYASQVGIGQPSLLSLGFGLLFVDYDLDGWQDLAVVNGHIDDLVESYQTRVTYRQAPLLFRNLANGKFRPVGAQAGEAFRQRYVGRGAAAIDYDNDGDLDLVITENGGPAHLLRNERQNANHWLQIHLVGSKSNRDGIGARVKVRTGNMVQQRLRRSGSSYLSESDPRLTFGLGSSKSVDRIEVYWPSGATRVLEKVAAGRLFVVREGP